MTNSVLSMGNHMYLKAFKAKSLVLKKLLPDLFKMSGSVSDDEIHPSKYPGTGPR